MQRVCKECGDKFEITEEDKKWYIDRKFNLPKRCKSCRRLRRLKIIGGEEK